MTPVIINSSIPISEGHFEVSAEDSFINALTTRRGSVYANPTYGTDFYLLRHRNVNAEWLIDFRRYVKDACSFDPRLLVENIEIEDSSVATGEIFFSIYLSGNGAVEGMLNV